MRYSEAIRLGAMLKPQGFGMDRDTELTACADDAARLAVGEVPGDNNDEEKPDTVFPICDTPDIVCPFLGCGYGGHLVCVVTHLNDFHCKSRESIAAWVQTIEDAQEPKPPEHDAAEHATGLEMLLEAVADGDHFRIAKAKVHLESLAHRQRLFSAPREMAAARSEA